VDSQPDADIQITGYRIEARVGRGGMGEVYRAVQLDLGRQVALKILAPELAADDRFRRRFLRESRIAASIDHPSIIPIYQTGEEGGLLYIAMRYVDGPDLATLLRREGRLEPARALAIMAQVASALDAAHERGLVHRDVKPANILLASGRSGSDGHCYLCDFGLIKQVGSEQVASALTATNQFVGTIPYVAPEQIEGKAIDGRTDVYSLGCVLFHCLAGSVPFEGANDVEVVFAHLGKPPPPLSARAPGLPSELDAVVARAMAKSKEDRWPTCSSLVAALATHLPTPSPRPSPALDAPTRSMPHPSPPPTPGSGTQILDPAAEATEIPGPADPGPGFPDHAGPPLARPAGTPVAARPASGPAAGKGGRHRGRVRLTVLAAIVLPVVAYVAAVQLLGGEREPQLAGAPTTLRPRATAGTTCRWTRPEVGTSARSAPLAAIRAHMGWSDRFVVDEMRLWTASDGNSRWYVKAHQEEHPSRRGRWLVRQQEDGQRLVLASAGFTTKGYAARDWRLADGQRDQLTAVAGCLTGT
jgi:serine/threonine protein kinase